jgi:hypothetical protein
MSVLGVDPYLISRLDAAKQASGLEVRFNCPMCVDRRNSSDNPDREKKLYVNFAKGLFHCVRCDWRGTVATLYRSLGLQLNPLQRSLPSDIRESIGILDAPEEDVQELSGVPTNDESCRVPPCTTDWQYQDAWYWLLKRLSTVPIEEVYSLVTSQVVLRGIKYYWDRVFFIDRYKGSTRYWTARAYVDGVKPKYLNPYGIPRHSVMFNQEAIEASKFDHVIICEGVISAIVAGPNAVATYGRCVTDAQISILLGFQVARFIIASETDCDAKKNTLALAEALRRCGKEVCIVDCPEGQDPADMGREAFLRLVNLAEPYTWSSNITRRLRWTTN